MTLRIVFVSPIGTTYFPRLLTVLRFLLLLPPLIARGATALGATATHTGEAERHAGSSIVTAVVKVVTEPVLHVALETAGIYGSFMKALEALALVDAGTIAVRMKVVEVVVVLVLVALVEQSEEEVARWYSCLEMHGSGGGREAADLGERGRFCLFLFSFGVLGQNTHRDWGI